MTNVLPDYSTPIRITCCMHQLQTILSQAVFLKNWQTFQQTNQRTQTHTALDSGPQIRGGAAALTTAATGARPKERGLGAASTTALAGSERGCGGKSDLVRHTQIRGSEVLACNVVLPFKVRMLEKATEELRLDNGQQASVKHREERKRRELDEKNVSKVQAYWEYSS